MKPLNLAAALDGVVALIMLSLSSHAFQLTDLALANVRVAALVQLGCGAAGLALADRRHTLASVAGWLITIGALAFASQVYVGALFNNHVVGVLAPLGGVAMIGGWLIAGIAAAKP